MARTSKASTSTSTSQTNTDARIGAAEGSVVVDDGSSFTSTVVDSKTGTAAVAEGGKTSRKALDVASVVTSDALKSNNYALEEAFSFGTEVVSSLNETARNALDGIQSAASEVISVSRSEQNQALETVARAAMVIAGVLAVAWAIGKAK